MNLPTYDKFKKIINNPQSVEQDCQDYIERHPDLLILDHLLNHQLHANSILTKVPLDTSLITDFVYLSKSSNKWHIILVELENPHVPLFSDNKSQITPTAKFTKRISQIDTWRDYIKDKGNTFINKLDPIRVPLNKNSFDYKYVLIVGRDNQISSNKAMRDRIKSYERHDLRIHTYDSLLRYYKVNGDSKYPSNILKLKKDKFTFKYVHSKPGPFFSHIESQHFILEKSHREKLIKWGYDIEEWEKGRQLGSNGKTFENQFSKLI